MKRYKFPFLIAAVLSIVLGIQSCNKDNVNSSNRNAVLNISNLKFKLPVIKTAGEYDSVIDFNFFINMDSFIKLQNPGFDTSNIKSVQLTACVVWTSPDTGVNNFSNFHTCSVGISSGTEFNITKIASFTDVVDTPAYFLTLPKTYNWNIARYFKSDSICFRMFGNVRRPTTDSIDCWMNVNCDMFLSK